MEYIIKLCFCNCIYKRYYDNNNENYEFITNNINNNFFYNINTNQTLNYNNCFYCNNNINKSDNIYCIFDYVFCSNFCRSKFLNNKKYNYLK